MHTCCCESRVTRTARVRQSSEYSYVREGRVGLRDTVSQSDPESVLTHRSTGYELVCRRFLLAWVTWSSSFAARKTRRLGTADCDSWQLAAAWHRRRDIASAVSRFRISGKFCIGSLLPKRRYLITKTSLISLSCFTWREKIKYLNNSNRLTSSLKSASRGEKSRKSNLILKTVKCRWVMRPKQDNQSSEAGFF